MNYIGSRYLVPFSNGVCCNEIKGDDLCKVFHTHAPRIREEISKSSQSILSKKEQAIICEFRRITKLPLDDIFVANDVYLQYNSPHDIMLKEFDENESNFNEKTTP